MVRPFALPDLGEGLTEAEIVKVLVHEGDVLAEDAPLLEVETDKATVEIPSPYAGRVARVHVQPGQTVKVGDVLVTFEDSAGVASGRGGAAANGGGRRRWAGAGARGRGQAAGDGWCGAAAASAVRAVGAGGAATPVSSASHHRRAHDALGQAHPPRDPLRPRRYHRARSD